jgi:peptidoglycan/LPS O-acetylase OafA/YrhL
MVAMTVTAALAAEGIYFLAANGVTTVLGSGSDPFQPSIIAFNVGAVACGYLAGVALVRPRRSRRVKAVVRSGSDNAYGIYLSHMIFITMLTWVGWAKLGSVIPWPLLCLVTVAIVFALGMALTSFLARTPLAVPLTGRTRVPWRLPRFLTAHPAVLETAPDHVEPVATSDAGYPNAVSRARSV